MSLTINQEKQIRGQRATASGSIETYRLLARKVALYRRAQKLPPATKDRADLIRSIAEEIDALLAKLGIV